MAKDITKENSLPGNRIKYLEKEMKIIYPSDVTAEEVLKCLADLQGYALEKR